MALGGDQCGSIRHAVVVLGTYGMKPTTRLVALYRHMPIEVLCRSHRPE